MIRVWGIPLAPLDTRRVQLAHTHAVVSRVLDDDHWQQDKPWTLRPITSGEGVTLLAITTIGDTAAQRLVDGFTPGSTLDFGGQPTTSLTPPAIVEAADSAAIRAVEPRRSHVVHFMSPTTFLRDTRSTPMVDASRIYRSARSRWASLLDEDPPEFHNQDQGLGDIWISDIDGASRHFRTGKMHVSGFTGRARYVCDTDDAARVFTALLEFSRLVGLGAKTRRGLGCIDITAHW